MSTAMNTSPQPPLPMLETSTYWLILVRLPVTTNPTICDYFLALSSLDLT